MSTPVYFSILPRLASRGGCSAACWALVAAAQWGCDASTSSAPAPEEPPVAQQTFAVGDVARAKGYDLQVHRVGSCAPSPYLPTKASSLRLGIEVSVTNRGREGLQVNPFYARLEDGSSRDYYFTLDGCEPPLQATQLGAGKSTKGWITFDVAKTATDLKLRYGPLSARAEPLGSVEVELGDAAAVHRLPAAKSASGLPANP